MTCQRLMPPPSRSVISCWRWNEVPPPNSRPHPLLPLSR